MATRYYPTAGSPPARYYGAYQGSWQPIAITGDRTWSPVQPTIQLKTSKANCGSSFQTVWSTNQQGNHDALIYRYVTPPLEAQSISGTFNLCFGVLANWDDPVLGYEPDSVVRYKVHVYLAQGQTTTPRTVLVDNYVDSVDFPANVPGMRWRSLASAQSVASATAQAGDVIVVELGLRIVSSPEHIVYYPDDMGLTRIDMYGVAANTSTFSDAAAGDSGTSRNSWFEFSATLTHQAASDPPANDSCADAITISELPYTSDEIDTSSAVEEGSLPNIKKRVWWQWTAPADGAVFFTSQGTNYACSVDVYTGSCGALTLVTFPARLSYASGIYGNPRSQAFFALTATEGTTYYIAITQSIGSVNSINTGGLARLVAFWRSAPQENDLYFPNGIIAAVRDGAVVNMSADYEPYSPTGIGIDYTQREVNDNNGGTHSGERLLVALHDVDLVELLDLATLNLGELEVDYIADPWTLASPSGLTFAQMHVTADGELYQASFGNGYLFASAPGLTPQGYLNAVSNNTAYSALRQVSAIAGDNQGGSFTDTRHVLTVEHTAPWAISIDEATGDVYYTSSAYYIDIAGAQDVVRVYNLNTQDERIFATLDVQGTHMPGLKGLQFIPGGGLLVCNGNVVQRLDADGALVTTYTPSVPLECESLGDVKLTADGEAFWTIDIQTSRLFKFDLATGEELLTTQPYLSYGAMVQMAIYQPDGVAVPPAPECVLLEPIGCWSPGVTPLGCAGDTPAPVGCWSPSSTPLGCGPRTNGATGCWSGFSQNDLQVGLADGGAE
jgi:hypothetical protein